MNVRSKVMTAELTNVVYACKVTVHGGRGGHAQSADGKLNVDLSPTADKAGTGTNPEQLFAAGYGACFHSALMAEAKGAGVDLSASTIVAHVSLGPIKQGGFGLAVTLDLEAPGLDPSKARELFHAAHQRCPYSNAIRGNVGVRFLLGGQPLAPAAS